MEHLKAGDGVCEACNGEGEVLSNETVVQACPDCGGTGMVKLFQIKQKDIQK